MPALTQTPSGQHTHTSLWLYSVHSYPHLTHPHIKVRKTKEKKNGEKKSHAESKLAKQQTQGG